MVTGTGSIHDLVIVVAYLGRFSPGYAGMTVWERKGGRPGGGVSSAGCWGPWACSSSYWPAPGRAKSIASRAPVDSFPVPTARSPSGARHTFAVTASVTSPLPLSAVRRDTRRPARPEPAPVWRPTRRLWCGPAQWTCPPLPRCSSRYPARDDPGGGRSGGITCSAAEALCGATA